MSAESSFGKRLRAALVRWDEYTSTSPGPQAVPVSPSGPTRSSFGQRLIAALARWDDLPQNNASRSRDRASESELVKKHRLPANDDDQYVKRVAELLARSRPEEKPDERGKQRAPEVYVASRHLDATQAQSGGNTRSKGPSRVFDIVRDVVAEIAPEELVLVDGLAGLDHNAVRRMLGGRGGQREPLGFALGALVTPIVWLGVDEPARRIASAAENAARGTKAILRKFMRRPAVDSVMPELTRKQLAEIHQQILRTALTHGLEDGRARQVADAVTGRLALVAQGDDAAERDDPDHN
ncbi:hypothetical protein ABZ815_20645 [Nonomuraea sp. NPDC047529]|uniref:hypothetical protein n=1 Tax=Nonomuraea sp. NPDC047529 TaxID=3155623 RepID=UPI0033D5D14D